MNEKYIEEKLNTKIIGEYDIIVVGGGPAGCGAAISAARNGAKVLLVEAMNCLGGMWTSGLVNPMFDFENKTGLIKEIVDKLEKRGAWGGFCNMCFNYEEMKVLLEEMCISSGVEILYNTMYVKPIMRGNAIGGIVCENISGRCAYIAGGVIDCSSDGRVAADCGAEFELGDKGDYTKCQAMTLMYLVSGFPKKYLDSRLEMHDFVIYESLKKAYEAENKKLPFDMPYIIPIPDSDFAVIQFTHMYGYNPTDPSDITKATIEGRKQMIEAYDLLKKHDEEFKSLHLIYSAPYLGIRESRRIKCEYTVCDNDLKGSKFADNVADVTFNADIHTPDEVQKCYAVKAYQVPLRAMKPVGVENLLVAGKAISGTQRAQASYRVTADCCAMGEGAGRYMADRLHNRP